MNKGGNTSEKYKLSEMTEGESGCVFCLDLPSSRAENLYRLGLIPNTEITCLRRSPFGDPTIYRFRGTDAALRCCDAERVILTVYPDSHDVEERA